MEKYNIKKLQNEKVKQKYKYKDKDKKLNCECSKIIEYKQVDFGNLVQCSRCNNGNNRVYGYCNECTVNSVKLKTYNHQKSINMVCVCDLI